MSPSRFQNVTKIREHCDLNDSSIEVQFTQLILTVPQIAAYLPEFPDSAIPTAPGISQNPMAWIQIIHLLRLHVDGLGICSRFNAILGIHIPETTILLAP